MNRPPDVEAILTLLPTSEGGREHPAFSGYRPNHLVRQDYLTSGTITCLDSELIAPGESGRVQITYITPEVYPHCMWEGRVVRVQEGGRLIGHARITAVLNSQLLGSPGANDQGSQPAP